MQNRQQQAATEISHSYPTIHPEDIDAVTQCLASHQLVAGGLVRSLEETIAADMGYRYAAATVNGSQALHLALRAEFNGLGARVGLQSYLCRTVHDAIALSGCEPVLLDIEAGQFCVSLDQALVADLEAVVVPHMFGIRSDIQKFLDAGLFVIEDCAQRLVPQSLRASEPKAPLRILSFSATKMLTGGEGGMLLMDDEQLYERVRRLRDAPYDFPQAALWLPYTDLQAALVLAQWQRIEDFLAKRKRLAELYLQELDDELGRSIVPEMRLEDTHHFRFVLRVDDPRAVIDCAGREGIAFRQPVGPMPLHALFDADGDFSATDDAMAHLLSLPIYPELTEEQTHRVAQVAKESISEATQNA